MKISMLIASALVVMTMESQASGYRFGSQSVSAQSTADANGAEASDSSTIFYNPAGMVRLDGLQINLGATIVMPKSDYTDLGSTRFTGQPTGGNQAKDYLPNAVVAPSFYLSQKLNEHWTAGLGLFVPYGAKLDFGRNWAGRYALTDMKLEAVTLNPSIAYKLDEHHAFGFGISAEHMKAALGQSVDIPGTISALSTPAGAAQSAALASRIIALGGNPALLRTAADGRGSNDVQDWGWGINLGYMWTLDKNTRIGLAYRSSIVHKLRGSTVWDFSTATNDPIVNGVLAAASNRANSAALVQIKTPETLSINAFHQFDPRWAGMADVTFTRNNRLNNLNIEFPGTGEGAEVIRQKWKNTLRVSVGANYTYSENVTLRGGFAYDQSPVISGLVHPALPDGDRKQISLGVKWKLDNHSSIDLAYSYIDVKDAMVNYTNDCNPLNAICTGNGETTKGKFKTNFSLVGLSYNHRF